MRVHMRVLRRGVKLQCRLRTCLARAVKSRRVEADVGTLSLRMMIKPTPQTLVRVLGSFRALAFRKSVHFVTPRCLSDVWMLSVSTLAFISQLPVVTFA